MRDIIKGTIQLLREFWNLSFPSSPDAGPNEPSKLTKESVDFVAQHFGAPKFTSMFNPIISPAYVPQSNASMGGVTKSQINNNSSKTVNQKSVTVGEIKIHAPNSNAREIASNINEHLQKHFSALVTNIDNGVLA